MKHSRQRDQISRDLATLQSLSRLSFRLRRVAFPAAVEKVTLSVKKVIGPQLLPRHSYEFLITIRRGSKKTCFYSLVIGNFYSRFSFPPHPSELLWHVLPAIPTSPDLVVWFQGRSGKFPSQTLGSYWDTELQIDSPFLPQAPPVLRLLSSGCKQSLPNPLLFHPHLPPWVRKNENLETLYYIYEPHHILWDIDS